MKKNFILLILIQAVFGSAFAQIQEPPKWTFSISPKDAKVGDIVELVYSARIPEGWYMYSTEFPAEGPTHTVFEVEANKGFQLIDKAPRPIKPKKKMDDIWGAEVAYFVGNAEFRQKVKITAPDPVLKGLVTYQFCIESETDGRCIQDEKNYEFKISAKGAAIEQGTEINAVQNIDTATAGQHTDTTATSKEISKPTYERGKYAAFSGAGECKPIKFEGDNGQEGGSKDNLILFFIVAFISGLAALLTPCVFPMIPMTVTFFMKKSGSRAKGIRNGMIYGVSIIAIFTIIGTLFSLLFGVQGANEFSTNAVVNIFFFLVFVLFAMSFFGMFEITLPSRFVNNMDKKSDKGGLGGVFFMAFTLVLVSFSCTGPIVGSILVESSQGSFLRPVVGMVGFSLAFALPFTLFAIFPEWLNSLPKSGGWLNSVKVVLGFIELALGLKFLSVADQTYHWHLLDREIYIALWIIIFLLMGVYLLGKLKFAHDSDVSHVSVPRLFMAIATFSFVVYLVPGMWGASLPGLSGYLPPTTSHSFNLPAMIKGKGSGSICEKPKYAEFLHLPHGLQGYFDYKQAVDCARELKKPIFIDFTGHGCVNCRKMEEQVWATPEVLRRLEEDFVVVALYVDDRTEAPEEDWVTSRFDGKVKKTIGRINGDLQICRFGNNAQPYYCLIDLNEELLATPRGTNYDVKEFIKFLDDAKAVFKKRHP